MLKLNNSKEYKQLYKALSFVVWVLGVLAVANALLIPVMIFLTGLYPSGVRFLGIVLSCWSAGTFTLFFIVALVVRFVINAIFGNRKGGVD